MARGRRRHRRLSRRTAPVPTAARRSRVHPPGAARRRRTVRSVPPVQGEVHGHRAVVGARDAEEAGAADGEVLRHQHVVDLGAERRGGPGRPGGRPAGAGQAGGVAQPGGEDAAEGGVVPGGVEVAGEDGGGAGVRGGGVAHRVQLLAPEADLAGHRGHRVGELEPYGVPAHVGDGPRHPHRGGDAGGGPQREAAEDDAALGAAALDGPAVGVVRREVAAQRRVARVLALLDEDEVRLLAAHRPDQRAGALPELDVRGQHPQLGHGGAGGAGRVAGRAVRPGEPRQQPEQDRPPHRPGPPAGEQRRHQPGARGHQQPRQEREQLRHRRDAVGAGGPAPGDRAHRREQQSGAPRPEPPPPPPPPVRRVPGRHALRRRVHASHAPHPVPTLPLRPSRRRGPGTSPGPR
ncbi:hypothetical protein SUDANB6_03118 [Streptomyces sp. enrichment culture]